MHNDVHLDVIYLSPPQILPHIQISTLTIQSRMIFDSLNHLNTNILQILLGQSWTKM